MRPKPPKLSRERLASDPHRPLYHFLPPEAWTNDPDGLMHFKGEYHLFYQHNPYGPTHSNIHWGHAVSKDLVHWRDLPIALYPDQYYDVYGVYSGCGVNNNGVPTLIYTGISPESQCIATSEDMITWTKHPQNPVIAAAPKDLQLIGFRDPCVWKEGDTWYMIVGTGIRGVGGAILVYRSKDLLDWEYIHPAIVGVEEETGYLWEFPFLFPLGDKHVLTFAAIPRHCYRRQSDRSIYFSGTWKDHKFTPERQGELDEGAVFTAAHVFEDENGRRLMIGWLRERRSHKAKFEAEWSGVISLPRILSLSSDGELIFEPIPELESLRGDHVRLQEIDITPESPVTLREVKGDCLEIIIDLDPGSSERCGLIVRRTRDGSEETRVFYDRAGGYLAIDTERSSKSEEVITGVDRTALRLEEDNALKLRLFLDRSVLELFANNRTYLSGRVYPTDPEALGVALFAEGGSARVRSMDIWQMRSIW